MKVCVLLAVVWAVSAGLCAGSVEKLRAYEPQCYASAAEGIQPCLMMADASRVFGCGQCGQDAIEAPAVVVESVAELISFLTSTLFTSKRGLLLPLALINDPEAARQTIENPQNVAFIMVESPADSSESPQSFSADQTSPNSDFTSSTFQWNPDGTGLGFLFFPFQVFLISKNLALHIRESTQRHPSGEDLLSSSSPRYLVESVGQMYSCGENGSSPLTSAECLVEGKCAPVGGQTVWSAVGQLDNTVPLVGVAGPLDSDAFFRYNASGSSSEVASIAVMMTVAEAFGKFRRNQSTDMQVRPVFFGFHAESMGFAGSDRFFDQVDTFTCNQTSNITNLEEFQTIDLLDSLEIEEDQVVRFFPGCAEPYIPSLRFKEFENAEWAGFLDLTQIGTIQDGSPFFAHSSAQETAENFERVVLDSFGSSIGVSSASELPPTIVQSVRKHRAEVPAMLISGFDNTFTNPFFHSLYDSPEYLTSLNNLDLLCDAATRVTASLVRLAYPDTSLDESLRVPVECRYIEQFVGCLSAPGFECSVDDEVFGKQDVDFKNRVDASTQYPSSYFPISSLASGVQRGQSVKWDLISSFLGIHNAIEVTEVPCESSDDCGGVTLASNEFSSTSASTLLVARCISNFCVLSDTFLHEAYGSGLERIGSDRLSFGLKPERESEGTMTESFWDGDLALCALTEDSRRHDVVVLVVGLLVWAVVGGLGLATQVVLAKIDRKASGASV